MKKLFILYGAGNTGKTTTFNKLLEKINAKYLDKLVYFSRHSNNIDFIAVFQYENMRIGFYSSGDSEWEISHNLYELHHKQCDFIFGTSRTRGAGCEMLEKFATLFYGHSEENDVIEWFAKERATDEDNMKVTKTLFSAMEKLIK